MGTIVDLVEEMIRLVSSAHLSFKTSVVRMLEKAELIDFQAERRTGVQPFSVELVDILFAIGRLRPKCSLHAWNATVDQIGRVTVGFMQGIPNMTDMGIKRKHLEQAIGTRVHYEITQRNCSCGRSRDRYVRQEHVFAAIMKSGKTQDFKSSHRRFIAKSILDAAGLFATVDITPSGIVVRATE